MANLISIEDYKTNKGIAGFKEDERIDSLITSVSKLVKTYCGLSFIDFYTDPKTEYFSINWDTEFVQLRESPIVEIVSVNERVSRTSDYEELTEADFYLDENTDTVFRVGDAGVTYSSFPLGPGSVKIVYKAGYETCPEDLKLAVIDLVSYYLNGEHKQNRAIAGTSIQNQGTSSQPSSADFPDHIKRVLDLYRVYQ